MGRGAAMAAVQNRVSQAPGDCHRLVTLRHSRGVAHGGRPLLTLGHARRLRRAHCRPGVVRRPQDRLASWRLMVKKSAP